MGQWVGDAHFFDPVIEGQKIIRCIAEVAINQSIHMKGWIGDLLEK